MPVPLQTTFTYIVPEHLADEIVPMTRVVVPFGGRKYYTGIVKSVSDKFDGGYDLKEIVWCPDKTPILRRPQFQLWEWLSDYYACSIGDVLKAALPAGLKIESETIVEINPDFVPDEKTRFTPKMTAIWEALKTKGRYSVNDLGGRGASALSAVYSLMDQGAVVVKERLTERFRPKREEYYRLKIERGNPEAIEQAFKRLRSPRQQKTLLALMHLSDFSNLSKEVREVSRENLQAQDLYDRTILKSFESKGILEIETREVSRFKWTGGPLKGLPTLTEAQTSALKQIHKDFSSNPVVLLRGVTSSGKTEIYIHLIDFILKQNKQVLYLVPEIALTTQLTRRLQDVFGQKVIIYHSRFSDAERGEIWKTLLKSNEPKVIIGARSSVFLPFAQLGLVIVDEEHEQSYKQFDPAPRYNARDVATVLSRMHGAKTLLASATPSIESYSKALNGRYGLVELTERYSGAVLPEIEVVDMSRAYQKGEVKESLASQTLTLAKNAIENKEQVIFFHNRRGYSPIAKCKACEYIPKCTDCDVSLSYHKKINRLVCHYCGKEYLKTDLCPVCKEPTMEIVGYGTERVEDNIAECFPNSKLLRMDLDTTRNKEDYSKIIDAFSEHKADILVGTQMVTKGLDFGNVSTVVVLNADMLINYPDFRASERAFDMLEQVSGRAGRRKETPGKVIIQTRQPDSPILGFVVNHDYEGFFAYEMAERKTYGYPPFTRLIYIYARHRDAVVCRSFSTELSSMLRQQLGTRILGPQEPNVNRVKNLYIRRIMVKIEPEVSVKQIKEILKNSVTQARLRKEFKNVDVYFDVDPL